MDKALYISMTGAKHTMLAQAAHSNNLANANTTGFRADFAQARSMPVYFGEGQPTRAYALTENPGTNFISGSLIETGNELDVAIKGEGLFAVQAADGTEAYTRAGDLFTDSAGILRTGSGLPVLGSGGPIALPPHQKVEIGSDGTLSVRGLGESANNLALVDTLRLVNPSIDEMEKGSDGLIRLRSGENAPIDPNVQVISGFLESSNVNTISEFTDILTLSRQYEMSIKLMKTVKENSEASSRLLSMQ